MIIICGPCVIESGASIFRSALEIIEVIRLFSKLYKIDFYFKASCIKDNRSSNNNFPGIGFKKGIKLLDMVRDEYQVKITTDFHTPHQIEQYGHEVDLIQIPAFLAMQSSLINTAAKIGKPIHLKKPQFLSPFDIQKPVQKIKDINPEVRVIVTDRGTSFGYDGVMMDSRHIRIMKRFVDEVIVDVTHPQNHSRFYDRTFAKDLGMASIAVGADGVFIESHYQPEVSLCDKDCQIACKNLHGYLSKFIQLYEHVSEKKG